jgi:zinc and cadmium transporter
MSEYGWLAFYSVIILLISLIGGHVPLMMRLTHSRLQFYLSLSAGVMLGAAFFHVMPDAIKHAGNEMFGVWMAVGVVGLFCIERFIAPHSHEMEGGHNHDHEHHKHDHAHDHDHESHEPDWPQTHVHDVEAAKDHKVAAPSVAGWMAVIGLTIHTFMNGVGLAGSIHSDTIEHVAWKFGPGLAMFLAIAFHKPADALAISTVLTRKGISRHLISLVQIGFVLMVPIGAVAFYLTTGSITEQMENQVTGAALAFSAGTFLFVALSDLLPEVQFHHHDRLWLFLCLVGGVVLMWFISFLEGEHDAPHDTRTHEAAIQKSHQMRLLPDLESRARADS